jgi:hypothetical protein
LKGVAKNADVVGMKLEEMDEELVLEELSDWPSKVTRAFSDIQDRFAELKRASKMLDERGIVKLVCASEMRFGIA